MYGAYYSPEDALKTLDDLVRTQHIRHQPGKTYPSVAFPLVIKADGLCAGKGVFLAPDRDSARDFTQRAMVRNEFGPGGRRILLEEAVQGEELSVIILTDGQHYA